MSSVALSYINAMRGHKNIDRRGVTAMAAALTVIAIVTGLATLAALASYSPGLALVSAPLVGSFCVLACAMIGSILRRPRRHGQRSYVSMRA